jgi:GAF domain-containing protein
MKSNFQSLSKWLYQDVSEWRPGYWGIVPYLLVLRCLVALGVWLRFRLHSDQPLPDWTYAILVTAIATAIALHWRPRERYSRLVYALLAGADVLVISACYWFTGNVGSDFYLFYYLPLLTAAEFLSFRWILAAFCASTCAFAAVVFGMPVQPPYMDGTSFQVLTRVFLPREVFYVAISLVWALRLRRERDSRQRSIQRQRQMQCLLECKRQVDQTFALEEVMQLLVDHARVDLEAPFSAGLLRESSPGGLRIARWSGQSEPDTETLALCENALDAQAPDGTALIVVRGRWIGAIAVRGLEARDQANSEEYLRSLAELAAIAYGRARLFDALREIGVATAIAVELNQKLESMLDELVDGMGFEYAVISLVDTYKERIRTIRGRNVPPGWIGASEHSLRSTDILADVVRTGRAEVSDSFDSRFSYAIWDRYNHERLARVFVPIVAGEPGKERVIGTIEAGCVKERRKAILDPNIEPVTRLGRESGDLIARSLPSVLLELIAARALDLTGADSASLHVFDGNREFLVAGAGKADKDFLRQNHPSPDGMGHAAMVSGKPVVQNQLPDSKRALRAAGVRSMAAFPLKLSGNVCGVLYMHYWREDHRFHQADLELVSVFVPQMEVAIQNSLLLQDFSKIDEKAWMVTGLQNVIRSLSSNLEMNDLLRRLASDALYMLDAKNVTLYQYVQEERSFSRAATAGRFEKPREMDTDVQDDDIVRKVVAEGRSRFISDAASNPFLRQPRTDAIPRPRFVERERVESCAILILRSPYDGEIVGCLFANYDVRRSFDDVTQKWLGSIANSLASSAAIAIKTARLHAAHMGQKQSDLQRREKELDALRAIDRVIVGGIEEADIRKVCETILDQVFDVLGPNGDVTLGDVTVWEELHQHLRVVAVRGFPNERLDSTTPLGVGLVGWAAQQRTWVLASDVRDDLRYRKANEDTRSELAVPIIDRAHGEERLLGVINLEHRNVNAFSERDRTFLETLAVQAIIAMHTVELYRRLQKQVRQALSLGTIAAHIQDGHMKTETVLRTIMTGVTGSEGLGLSRAILLEIDEEARELRGVLGIGAMTREQAEADWRAVEGAGLDALLGWVAEGAVQGGARPENEFNQRVREIRIPLDALQGPLRDWMKAGSVQVCHLHGDELAIGPLGQFYLGGEHCAVAGVPLKAGENVVGALVVDNRFLFTEREFDFACSPIMIAFAELAAMTIEGARLRARLADQRHLRNWRQASNRVAHVLKSRLRQILPLARDTAATLARRDVRAATAQLDKLETSLDEMRNVSLRMQNFGKSQKLQMSPVDLVDVLRLIVENNRILESRIETNFSGTPIYVMADVNRLPDVFVDLLHNADRVMRATGVPNPTIWISMRSEPSDGTVSVDVEDNGPGVPEVIRDSMYEPYVTNSDSTNAEGMGLGLAIIKDLVDQHGATIAYSQGERSSGARFTVRFRIAAASASAAVGRTG